MAVMNAKNSRRFGLIAAALATVALPGLAQAQGWAGRGDGGGHAREERGNDAREEGRAWQNQAPQQRQAPQQSGWSQPQAAPQPPPAPPQQRGYWGGAQDRPQRPEQPGGWNRAQTPPEPQQGGWNRQNGNGWQGRDHDRDAGQNWRNNQQGGWGDRNHDRDRDRAWRNQGWSQGGWGDRDRDHDGDRRWRNQGWSQGGYYQGGYYQGGYYNGQPRRDRRWDGRWRNDRRYDWFSYRRSNPSYYRVGSYYAPYRNYSYHRLNIGFFLDALFFGDRYRINNPWQYRLPDVYGPYRWVRYYDDAVLVDTYSGEVMDVIYDFFW